jgi:signal transduction histidine kinase
VSAADQRARYATVTAGARIFALVVLVPPAALTGEPGAILNATLIAAVWMCAILADSVQRTPVMPALVIEASLITFLTAVIIGDSTVLLPALVIPPFVGGLVRGTRGAFEVLGAELAVLAASTIPNADIDLDPALIGLLFTWLMAALGCGLIAAVVHAAKRERTDTATSYRDARALITQLLDLSGELIDGLDPVSISENIIDLCREELPLSGAVVYTRSPYGITPLVAHEAIKESPARVQLVEEAFSSGLAHVSLRQVAFPLRTDAGVVAVVAAGVHGRLTPSDSAIEKVLDALSERLRPEALQLDTALLFSTVRDEATAEERRRLARDLHDGVAQDMASLGYLIDDLVADAESEEMVAGCNRLRTELTSVVAELRRSVFSLRNEAHRAMSFGASIQALARHLESRFDIPVDVQVDEGEVRLRPDIESELLRITQEAMNNAAKHARGTRIWVGGSVQPPFAEITVTDDGCGLQPGRDDSHGVRIMRERARRMGAVLELRNSEAGPGTLLRVTLNATSPMATRSSELEGTLAR